MKILYVCPYLPSNGINAGSNRIFELVKRLAIKNDVSVISFMTNGQEGFLDRLKKICKTVDVINKDYTWKADALSALPPMVDEFYYKPVKELIRKRLEGEDFDIAHFEYLIMAQYAPDSCRPVKFLTEHELHFLSQLKNLKLIKGIWNKVKLWGSANKKKIYEINICNKFDMIITVTKSEADILSSYSPWLKITSIPMGADHQFFYPYKETEEDIDIIFIGFFGHYPNVDAVLYFYNEIFSIVRKRFSNVNFTIIGYNPPDSILSLGRDKNVTVTGYVADIRPYLARSKVFIMPIRLGAGMRGKLFEAWGMAKAVVSTSIGCEGIDIVNGENILVADDPENFAMSVIELLSNVERRRYLGKNGRRIVEERYNWDIIANRLERLYRETVKNKLYVS